MNNYQLFHSVLFPQGIPPDETAMYGLSPLTGHSLTWNDERRPAIGRDNKMIAKIWVPEDPRKHKKSKHLDDSKTFVVADSTS